MPRSFFLFVRVLVPLSLAFLLTCSPTGGFTAGDLAQDYGIAAVAACGLRTARAQAGRTFTTGFEQVSDFNGFYITPSPYQGAVTHGLSTAQVHGGTNSHLATISNAATSCTGNCNHRGYPTIQLHKTAAGGMSGVVFTEFYVYVTMTINDGQWLSLATLTPDSSDAWSRTVLVNVGNLGRTGGGNYMHLMHVPNQGESGWTYQAGSTNGGTQFPQNQWVKVSICLDLNPATGWAKAWMNDVPVSAAPVSGGCGVLEQAHFGLYAPPAISSGVIYNDDLQIREVSVCPK